MGGIIPVVGEGLGMSLEEDSTVSLREERKEAAALKLGLQRADTLLSPD